MKLFSILGRIYIKDKTTKTPRLNCIKNNNPLFKDHLKYNKPWGYRQTPYFIENWLKLGISRKLEDIEK